MDPAAPATAVPFTHRPLVAGDTVGILTSGGDAPGMNAAVRTAVKLGLSRGLRVLAVESGYRGLIDGHAHALSSAEVEEIHRRGGTVLGSARALDFQEPAGQARAQQSVRALGLDALLVIGGNGSLTGARVAAGFVTARGETLRVVGMPASIDNDIGHSAPAIGVDTALNTIVEACDRISDTAASHNRVFIIEVMGRDCGYLAMASAVACGADAVLFRESGRSEAELVEQIAHVVQSAFARTPPKPRVLVIKSEGVKATVEGLKQASEARLAERGLRVETRSVVLGHVVRGGAPSAQDRLMAGRLGRAAMWAAIEGQSDAMVGWQPQAGSPWTSRHDPHCQVVPLEEVLRETRALLDGSSPVMTWRTRALSEVEDLMHF